MKRVIAAGLVVSMLAVGGWAYARWWTAPPPIMPVVQKQSVVSNHARPKQLLGQALQRLHTEALEHFHADPTNGFTRMPVVYEKVVKEWATPWFSPGELDADESIPFQEELEKIHAASLKDFTTHEKPGVVDEKLQAALMLPQKFDPNKKVWEAKTVDLIGMLKHVHPVAYISEHLPNVHDDCEPKSRPLDDFELAAVAALQKGENHFARSRDGVIRLMGAIRARSDCLNCHMDKQQGDLLGALSYTVRPAEYVRVPWHKRTVK